MLTEQRFNEVVKRFSLSYVWTFLQQGLFNVLWNYTARFYQDVVLRISFQGVVMLRKTCQSRLLVD